MYSASGRAACGYAGTPRVSVTVAGEGGWNVQVELNGRVAITAHCTDWHRVERRRARFEAALTRITAARRDPKSAA